MSFIVSVTLSDNISEVFKKSGETAFTTKAYNGRIISEWLHECLKDAHSRLVDPDNQLPLLCSCMILCCCVSFSVLCYFLCCIPFPWGMNRMTRGRRPIHKLHTHHGWNRNAGELILRNALVRFYGLQERFQMHMDAGERIEYHAACTTFVSRYVALAHLAVRQNKDEFRLRPKLHVPTPC